MTYPVDLLGRAPVMKAPSDEDYTRDDDWRGEGKIKSRSCRSEKAKRQRRYNYDSKD